MSRYIGKRVSYPCTSCGEQCTISKKKQELPDGNIVCLECLSNFGLKEEDNMGIRKLNKYWRIKLLEVWQEKDVELFEKYLSDNFTDIENINLGKKDTKIVIN